MNRRILLAGLAAPLCALLICTPLIRALAQSEITAAQPELPKQHLVIITRDGIHHDFNVEVATTPHEQEVGLMFRPTVPEDGGMLFDWGGVRDSSMWMRNTLASLDMVFINTDGTIHRIAENTTPQSLAIIPSGGPVRATLELAAGTATRLHLRVGDKVESPALKNTG